MKRTGRRHLVARSLAKGRAGFALLLVPLLAVAAPLPTRAEEAALVRGRLASTRGGAQRLLSRLHAELPRVPFVTGWVDRDLALVWAERAVGVSHEHPGNVLILALAWLDLGVASRREEAIAMLERVAELEPRDASVMADLSAREVARERLAALGLR